MATDEHTEEIERLLRRGEKDARTHTFARLADLYRKTGALDRALEVVERGLKHHPHYLNARLVHARVLRELGRPIAARAAFECVLEIDSENLVAREALNELGAASVVRTTDSPVEPGTSVKSGPPLETDGPVAAEVPAPAATRWLARLDADWQAGRGVGRAKGGEAEPAPASVAVGETPPAGPPGGETPEPDVPKPPEPTESGGGPARTSDRTDGDDEPAGPTPPVDPDAPVELETATLASLYVRQGLFDRAIAVYERLLARDPYNARLAAALDEARRRGSGMDRPRAAKPAPAPVPSPAVRETPSHADGTDPEPSASRKRPGFDRPSASEEAVPRPAPARAESAGREIAGATPSSIRELLRMIVDGEARAEGPQARTSLAEWLARLGRDR